MVRWIQWSSLPLYWPSRREWLQEKFDLIFRAASAAQGLKERGHFPIDIRGVRKSPGDLGLHRLPKPTAEAVNGALEGVRRNPDLLGKGGLVTMLGLAGEPRVEMFELSSIAFSIAF